MTNEPKQYTKEQVARKKDEGRTIIILHDKVYDVTSFLNEHPGGEEVLLEHSGKDSSDDFDDIGHSKDAFDLMKNYLVGELTEAERTNKKPRKGWVAGYSSSSDKNPRKQLQGPGVPFLLLLAGLVAVAATAYFYLF
ncbi:cytochrome b5-like [Prorops nasuta]|uniref:cytochrome b5-like n=1 Tax=Prorops nasuta TaxID=863751 RepID=UPI0034CE647E